MMALVIQGSPSPERGDHVVVVDLCVESDDEMVSEAEDPYPEKSIVTSSSLYPYRGPPVEGPYTPYEIELKYSRSERKSYSRIVAKYTLDCQRNRKQPADADIIPAVRSPKFASASPPRSSPVKVKLKTVKTKAKNLTRPRLKVHRRRIWERVRKTPNKDEYISALGLVKKTDVIIGPRPGTSAVVSSLYRHRKGRRDRSLSPSARVVLEKLPNSENKTFIICPFCDFFAPSKSDVRRHRGEVHKAVPDLVHRGRGRPKRSAPPTVKPSPPRKKIRLGPPPVPGTSRRLLQCSRCQFWSSSAGELEAHQMCNHLDPRSTDKLVKSFIH